MTIKQESHYRQYIRDRGIGMKNARGDSYIWRLRRVSRSLGEIISPTMLNCNADVEYIAERLRGRIPDNAINDCKSAMTLYVDMVRYYRLSPER